MLSNLEDKKKSNANINSTSNIEKLTSYIALNIFTFLSQFILKSFFKKR